jgi:hypothetical protein
MKYFAFFMGMCEFMTAFFSLIICVMSIFGKSPALEKITHTGDMVFVSIMMVMLMVFISLRVLITSYDDKENHEESTQVD